jgi:hypothetical protein
MKKTKKMKVLKVYEKYSLLGGLDKGSLNLNMRACDDPTCCCDDKLPIAPTRASSAPSDASN